MFLAVHWVASFVSAGCVECRQADLVRLDLVLNGDAVDALARVVHRQVALCCAVLCCAILCCAVLRRVMLALCCVVLCCAVSRRVVSYCVVLDWAVSSHVMSCCAVQQYAMMC